MPAGTPAPNVPSGQNCPWRTAARCGSLDQQPRHHLGACSAMLFSSNTLFSTMALMWQRRPTLASREDCFSTAGYIYHCSPSAPCGPWTQTWPWLLTLPLTSWVFLARYLSSLCHTGSQMLPVRAILCFHFLILKLLCQNLIQKAELRLLPFVPRILGNISSGAQIYLFALDTQNEAAECFSPLLNYTSVYAANQ